MSRIVSRWTGCDLVNSSRPLTTSVMDDIFFDKSTRAPPVGVGILNSKGRKKQVAPAKQICATSMHAPICATRSGAEYRDRDHVTEALVPAGWNWNLEGFALLHSVSWPNVAGTRSANDRILIFHASVKSGIRITPNVLSRLLNEAAGP